ncbi:MAG: hypothetical protein RBG13Loki_1495 [Promethearchaeota archaeon CR_4]|nr:MAG: hypothetical protein RBG13Loki_1495 [Candidatus Lokiarchaeota archaeon CR_4]
MIKLILFDLDDCLFDITELGSYARAEALNEMIKYGLKVDFKTGLAMLREVVSEYGSNHPGHFNIVLTRLKSLYPESLGNIPEEKLVAAAVIAYHRVKVRNIKTFPDVVPFLIKVRKNYPQIKIAILTDGIPVKQFEKILRLRIDSYFDDIIISDDIGIRKPNPRLFSYAVDKMKVGLEETLMVGDRIDNDIIPARSINIHTVLIHRETKYDVDKDQVRDSQPEFEIRSLSELFPILENLKGKK